MRGAGAAGTVVLAAVAMALAPAGADAPSSRGRAAARLVGADAGALAAELRPGARPRLVHAWATWCAPCRGELPALAALLRGRGRRLDVLLLALDDAAAAPTAAALLRRAGAPGRWLRALDGGAAAPLRALDPRWDGALPATWLVGADGRLLEAQRGFADLAALARALDSVGASRRRYRPPARPGPQLEGGSP